MPSNKGDLDDVALSSCGIMSDIKAEVDLEIAMREQLARTIEARISWGILLKKALEHGNETTSQESFRNVALDALSVLETPSSYILGTEPAPPPKTSSQTIRHSPRRTYQSFKPKPTFLYTRSNPATRQDGGSHNLYILKCPICSKTTFTSLQGLLNHARLSHNFEWGTHDECIRACAVVDNTIDLKAGTEVGLGPSGILPGLQTIFQNAVGVHSREPMDVPGEKGNTDATEVGDGDAKMEEDYLNQTLGLHEDSPALAPFLGKETVRRQIRVWEEDVDISSGNNQGTNVAATKVRWRMPFSHRNFGEISAVDSRHAIEQPPPTEGVEQGVLRESDEVQPAPPLALAQRLVSSESRFCFRARIVITDRSLSVQKDQMPENSKNYTHKWMISVEAPAYAHHITTILNAIEVTPANPSISIPLPPPTTEPPFVVVGVADKPFLAKVQLSFSGTSLEETCPDQKVVFEHWVDLDPIGDRGVVLGQDQVLDVELDKGTVLRPPRLGYTPIVSKTLWNQIPIIKPPQQQVTIPRNDPVVTDSLESQAILTKLAKLFPMTQGGRPSTFTVPYKLVPTQAYFKTLVVGRRKAIEFGRARAIQDAYSTHIQSLHNTNLRPLSVAEVYSWLLQNNHFIKVMGDSAGVFVKQEISGPAIKEETSQSQKEPETSPWCRICGMDLSRHAAMDAVKIEPSNIKEEKPSVRSQQYTAPSILASDNTCPIVPRALQLAKLPRIDIRHSMTIERRGPDRTRVYSMVGSPQALVSAADPRLTLHICRLVENLGLSKFRPRLKTAENPTIYPIDALGGHHLEIRNTVAPYALLALVTKSFVRVLVERGLEVANRDKIIGAGLSSSRPQKGNRRGQATPSRMLTPTHILSGILTRGRGRCTSPDALDTVVLLCMSKLGVAADPDTPEAGSQDEPLPRVKLEE